MVAAAPARRKSKKESLFRDKLVSELFKSGVRVSPNERVDICDGSSDLAGAVKFLLIEDRNAVLHTHWMLGGIWASVDNYGERLAILKSFLHRDLVKPRMKMLANYASIYRRWVGRRPEGKSWSYLRTHKPGEVGKPATKCGSTAAQTRVTAELAVEFLRKLDFDMPRNMTSEQCFAFVRFKDAALDMERMEDDDTDDFEEE